MFAPRLPDWMVRLDRLVSAKATAPYTWGVHDCCTLIADVALAITGVDRMDAMGLRGAYLSEQGAYRILARRGGMEGVLTAAFGMPVSAALAQVGDIGISGTAAVFFYGFGWLGQADVGLTQVTAPKMAWRCTGV